MTSKQYRRHLLKLFDRKLKEKRTKEEARQSLIDAGILDEHGNHTEPYKLLGEAIKRYSKRDV
jgi:hypothetical protein